ncbi:LPXTG-motif cell wall anchor domain protein [Marvinbryantia formatexigens DSM 14469]|uniref:LPXTG-motif cell wall anchor domain protein n=2 Tax=Marvinbryantia TaxID=248744 RepID=C6LB10_9FIRM|nr:LPXTG-motif cell wall anchor domain protein [Marvinbryantia formatexigens DSM 14469]
MLSVVRKGQEPHQPVRNGIINDGRIRNGGWKIIMKKWGRKGAAMLLGAAMLFSNHIALAENVQEVQMEQAVEAQAETPAEAPAEKPTEAPVTEAPSEKPTEAPTEAPAEKPTEAPTEAPSEKPTEATMTEAPVEKPTEASTEAPAEKQTEAPTEKLTEAPTEKTTEKQTEKEAETKDEYTWKKGGISVTVKVPESITLPKNAVLEVQPVKADGDAYKKDIALVEKISQDSYFGAYQIYDIHFATAKGKKISLQEFEDASGLLPEELEVTVTFENPLFSGTDFQKERLTLFHIRSMTEKELAAGGTDGIDGWKAALLETKAAYTPAQDGVTSVKFKTDGFSDFVFAATGQEPETEMQTDTESEPGTEVQNGTENEAETEAQTVTESEPETEAQTDIESESGTESETESETAVPVETETNNMPTTLTSLDAGHWLTISLQHSGDVANADAQYAVAVRGMNNQSFDGVQVLDGNGAPLPKNSYNIENGTLTITGKAGMTVKLEGLAAGTYTVDAGGNHFADGADALTLELNQDYTSVYQTNGANKDGTVTGSQITENGPVSIEIREDAAEGSQATGNTLYNQNVVITNVYTTVKAKLTDKSGGKLPDGGTFRLTFSQSGKTWSKEYTMQNGEVTVKGLPIGLDGQLTSGEYRWTEISVPAGYVALAETPAAIKLAKPDAASPGAYTGTAEFATQPVQVQVLAKDASSGKESSYTDFPQNSVEMSVTEKGSKESIWSGKNGAVLTGRLEVGKTYTLKQTTRRSGYIISLASRDFTVQNTGKTQTAYTENRVTVVQAGAVLQSDTGKYLSGATMEIRDGSGKTVKSFTSGSRATKITGELDPGTYTLVQTKYPGGHYTKNTQVSFTVSEKTGTANAAISNVTTKISISRKAFDSVAKDESGKDLRYMLAGARLQILDSAGNVVDEWTSTGNAYLCEGKLNVGEEYTLVEVSTPEGYEPGNRGSFSTVIGKSVGTTTIKISDNGKITPSVTMQTGRTRGKIRVAKRVSYKGTAIKMNGTFYFALFTDAAKTQRSTEAGVKSVTLTDSDIYMTVDFDGLPAGTYYVGETDANGNLLTGNESSQKYDIKYFVGEQIILKAGGSAIAEVVNDFSTAPAGGYSNVSAKELQQSYEQEYAGYGGSQAAAAELAAGANGSAPVQTGDTTAIIPYVIAVLAALVLLAAAVFFKRRKK